MAVFDLIVVGGGAAGFYGAIQAAGLNPGLSVLILERSNKLLSKVRVSGGGRCNVTHNCFDSVKFSRHYPRGEKPLRAVLRKYGASETVRWFASRGVALKAEEDGRMFPVTDNSQTIIDCFLKEAGEKDIGVTTGETVHRIVPGGGHFHVLTQSGGEYHAKCVLIAIGGSPKPDAYAFIKDLGHSVSKPIPSLFTFNDPGRTFSDLMGIAVTDSEVRIAGTKFRQQGPLLITHWGLSGPAVIRLSAWAAEYLHSVGYDFTVLVSWIGAVKEDELRNSLQKYQAAHVKQKIYGNPLFGLPQRLWVRLCSMAEIPEEKIWGETSRKNLNKLLENLGRYPLRIKGKTTFKEEFVTCGGVDLREVDMETLESKKVEGLFFAGEVLNVDGETGGFNFQAAWSTAFVAAKSILFEKNVK